MTSRGVEGGRHGDLLFGRNELFFIEGDSEAEPTLENLLAAVPYAYITLYEEEAGGRLAVSTESEELPCLLFSTDRAISEAVWIRESMAFLDMQILQARRRSEGASFFGFLTSEVDVSRVAAVEESLKELQGDDLLLFDSRILRMRPTALSADALFIAGSRFCAKWALATSGILASTKRTEAILIPHASLGLVVLLPVCSIESILSFIEFNNSFAHRFSRCSCVFFGAK